MTYITRKKLNELKDELKRKKTIVRQRIANRIQEAKSHGDLSENAEYSEAKEEQAFNEGRIVELENLINSAELVSKKKNKNIVEIGSEIIVQCKNKQKKELTIIGSEEANPEQGKISNESPLGQALLGQKPGSTVEVKTPTGKAKYKIIKIK